MFAVSHLAYALQSKDDGREAYVAHERHERFVLYSSGSPRINVRYSSLGKQYAAEWIYGGMPSCRAQPIE